MTDLRKEAKERRSTQDITGGPAPNPAREIEGTNENLVLYLRAAHLIVSLIGPEPCATATASCRRDGRAGLPAEP
ncbi:hypothetical protein RxyAA322_13620 [Rubrobacter xylanophilus]|uniref:Uncharacterized protein n=1 Tax=Rubrobacter xylanophilus TaxID=49319 RepID=A0A510HHX5_9ACTN|nr:hypothetical protein RxyAA322_13620 [Rubrobacter xylanophilus]